MVEPIHCIKLSIENMQFQNVPQIKQNDFRYLESKNMTTFPLDQEYKHINI